MVNVSTTLGRRDYVVILKAKQGELLAVQSTPPPSFVPLLELTASSKIAAVTRAWPHPDHVAWIHPLNSSGLDDADWAAEVGSVFSAFRSEGGAAVPVVTTSEPSLVLAEIKSIIETDGRGLVIRLDCEDALESGTAGLAADLGQVLANCSISAADCDIVIDAGLVGGGPGVQSSVVSSVLASFPTITDWRSIVVAFSAFPEVVGNVVATSSVGSIPRNDAAAYVHLVARWAGRDLTYSDYAVGVPTYADIKFAPIPNIRYALQGEWKVHRAAKRSDPSPQYIALAKDLAGQSYFSGAGFSPGDAYIQAVANGTDGPGNAGSYLKAAMSRHFHVVLDSLATHGAP